MINRGHLEVGQIILHPSKGKCKVINVSSIGALVAPVTKLQKQITAKHDSIGRTLEEPKTVSFKAPQKAFYISDTSAVEILEA